MLRDVAAEMSIGEYLIRAEWREKSLRVCKLKETNGNPVGGKEQGFFKTNFQGRKLAMC